MRYDPKNPAWPERDRLILSKGHSCLALYAILAKKGSSKKIFSDLLQQVPYIVGDTRTRPPGVEANTGSLGHGFNIGIGMALAGKADQLDYKVYTLWAMARPRKDDLGRQMAAAHFQLDNLGDCRPE